MEHFDIAHGLCLARRARVDAKAIALGMAAALPCLGGAAYAQTNAPPPVSSNRLQEVVVTAQKRVERLQNVPIAVNAASGTQLTAAGIESTTQLNAIAPGLNVRTQAGSFLPVIRGVGTQSNVVENPVALYLDGVYIPQQRDGLRDLLDIDQIAVLKGPQGTLFGRNSTGGVIQINTLRPSHDFHGNVTGEIDNYETGKAKLYVTGGLTDKLAASFSAEYVTQGSGWGRDAVTQSDTYKINHDVQLRAKFLYELSAKTNVTVIMDYKDLKELANSFQPLPGTAFTNPALPPPAVRFAPVGYKPGTPIGPTAPLSSPWDSNDGVNGTISFQGGGASVQVDHDFDFAKLVSVTSYRRGVGQYVIDDTASPTPLFIVRSPLSPNEDYTEELQLVSSKGQFNWQTGVYLFHNLNGADPIQRLFAPGFERALQTFGLTHFVPSPGPFTVAETETFGNEVTNSVAPYAQVDYEIVPKTKLTLGVRYTYEKRKFDGGTIAISPTGAVTPQTADTVKQLSISEPTVRAALDHQLTDDILGYVSYNTGIKSGGFNILNPSNPAYLSEKLQAYEAGFKSEFLGHRARLNVSGFYYDYTNIQVISFATGPQVITNGAGANLYGLDVDYEARLAAGLRLSGGLELEHSEFSSYPNATLGVPGPIPGTFALTTGSAKGNRLPLQQNVSGTAAIDYHRDEAIGAFDFDVTANYNGAYFFEPDNNLQQKAYWMVNTSLTWHLPNKRYSVTVWGRNLLDVAIISQTSTQVFGYSTTYNNPPLTFGATARVDF